jgi:hypothetical protein
MGKTHRSSQWKISSSEKKLLEEIKSLKQLPESENKAHDIEEKSQQLFILRGSSTVEDGGDTILYESFEGKFEDGSKAVAVYKKYTFNNYWEDVALVTWMTNQVAGAYFGADLPNDELYCAGCGFEGLGNWWNENDDGDFNTFFSIDFVAYPQLIQDLGLSGAKGFFQGGNMLSYQEKAEDILRGQKMFILLNEQKINSVSFPQSNISTNISTNKTETPSWAVAVVLCIFLFIARFIGII